MNKEQEIVLSLKEYAAFNIHNLAKQNEKISQIDEITSTFVDDINSVNSVITKDEAWALTRFLKTNPETNEPIDDIGNNLDDLTELKIRKLAKVILDIAMNTSRSDRQTHEDLTSITKYLHALLSRDYRTVELGFELEEYIDFFEDIDQEERKKFGEKLLSEWQNTKYID